MTLTEQLADAQKAYHDLMTGSAVVEVKDQNGESIKYSPANANKLASYIQLLQNQLNPTAGSTGPMRFWF